MPVLQDISWTGIGQIARQGTQLLTAIVLARLLTPADFGLLALVTVFTNFAGLFADFGMSSAVVYKQSVSSAELDFAFWLNVGAGLFLTCLGAFAAPLAGSFYGDPRVVPLTRAIALAFVIGSFGILPYALLQKALRFRALAIADALIAATGGVLAIAMAYRGFGVWSLVAQVLVTTTVTTVLRSALVAWRPGFRFEWRDGRSLWGFGTNLMGFNVVNYWCRTGDNLLIGKFCGAVELGLYSRAYALMLLPVSQVQTVLSAVMFPTLARMQESKDVFRRTYLLACQAIALVAFPIMVGLIVEADDFIYLLWGPRWVGVVSIIRVLAIAGIGNSVGTTVGWLYTATGRTDLLLRWSLFAAPVMLTSFAIGLHWGGIGVAIAYTCAYYGVLWYPLWAIPARLVGLSFGTAMRNLVRPLAASSVAMLCMVCVRLMLTSSVPLLRLAGTATAGLLAYAIVAILLRIPALVAMYNKALEILRNRLPAAVAVVTPTAP